MADLVFRKGQIVFPDGVREGDLVIAHGEIFEITPDYKGHFDTEFDCRGKYIFPGVIDVHVHMRVPGDSAKEDFTTGSMAALSGGVTTILDMPNNVPPVIDKKSLIAKRSLAEQDCLTNFGFFFGATEDNMEEIFHAKNIVGVKVYLGESTGGLIVKNDETLDRLLERVRVPVVFHAEDQECLDRFRVTCPDFSRAVCHSESRPPECAREAMKRVLHLWKKYENTSQIHFAHLSTVDEIAVLKKFKTPFVSAEVTPHHLFLNIDAYERLGFFAKVNPPLRSHEHQQALWQALHEGLIEIVASDHAPHLKSDKEGPYESVRAGFPGVETLFPLMLNAVYENLLDFGTLAKLTAENPARIFHIPRKGKIEVGYDADLVVVDMDMEKEILASQLLTKCAWSPFEGMKLHGWPVMTIVSGTVMYDRGKFVAGKRGREVRYGK